MSKIYRILSDMHDRLYWAFLPREKKEKIIEQQKINAENIAILVRGYAESIIDRHISDDIKDMTNIQKMMVRDDAVEALGRIIHNYNIEVQEAQGESVEAPDFDFIGNSILSELIKKEF